MRIISGKLKGRKLIDSAHLKDLRPTTDKNRQALFNILQSAKFLQEIDFKIQNSVVLDICAGTGAVAFEALSRGATKALLLDKNPKHLDLAKENAQKLGIENQTEFLLADARKIPSTKQKYDLIFIDPPYSFDVSEITNSLLEKEIIEKKTLIVIESKEEPKNLKALRMLDSRQYGGSWFGFFCLEV